MCSQGGNKGDNEAVEEMLKNMTTSFYVEKAIDLQALRELLTCPLLLSYPHHTAPFCSPVCKRVLNSLILCRGS